MFERLTKLFTMPQSKDKLSFSIIGNGILQVKSTDLIKSKKFREQVKIVKNHSASKK